MLFTNDGGCRGKVFLLNYLMNRIAFVKCPNTLISPYQLNSNSQK